MHYLELFCDRIFKLGSVRLLKRDLRRFRILLGMLFATLSCCRLALSVNDTPASFNDARKQSWRLYENALAVHTDLLYGKTDITAIQALLFMAFFAEALGSRSLEYMLISSASRLAQLKGLHLAVSSQSKLKKEEVRHRQYIWWVLYSYEKHLAWRSGRPSVSYDQMHRDSVLYLQDIGY